VTKKKIPILLILIFLIPISLAYRQQALSFHFVDEESNFVIGQYLLKGEKLYDDVFSNHQPLTYFVSAGIQKITQPNSLYLLVKRHRESVIIWSAFWALFLVFRFGWPLFFVVVIYEFTKIYLLGHLFLSESFSVYPLLYLSTLAFSKRDQSGRFEIFFSGVLLSFLFWILIPLWPLIMALFLILLVRQFNNRQQIISLIFGALFSSALVLFLISSKGYLHDVVEVTLRYVIPYGIVESLNWKSFVSPVLALFPSSGTATLMISRIFSLLLMINLLFLFFKKRYRYFLGLILVLGLSNLRFIRPGSEEYAGFHLLPWYGLLILLAVLSDTKLGKGSRLFVLKGLTIFLVGFGFICSINYARERLFVKKDMDRDLYVNYSRPFDIGQVVKMMKSQGETLFVGADESLIYWQAEIDHATRFTFYYSWMTMVPEIKTKVETTFKETPPTFFYFRNNRNELDLEKYLSNYKNLIKDGQRSELWVLRDKQLKMQEKQLKDMKFYGYSFD